jgi:hypothetical protein
MKKKILIVLLSVFLLSAMIGPSLSQEVEIGVSVGDWFKFEGTLLYYEAEEELPFPPSMWVTQPMIYNESDWQTSTVMAIDGNNVTVEVVTHWKNGTETTEEVNEDITEGLSMNIIPANMESGDLLRDEYDLGMGMVWPARYLNESIMVEYLDSAREANVLEWTQPTMMFAPDDRTTARYEWDKETGALVRYYQEGNTTAWDATYTAIGQAHYMVENVLVDTNLWTVIPEFPTGTAMLLVFIAITVTIDLYRRKTLKH